MKASPGATRHLQSLLLWAREELTARGVTRSSLKADRLLAGLLDCSPLELALYLHQELNPEQVNTYRVLVERVAGGEPLQYVEGFTDFFGHRIQCDRRALIPRPETEMLVEAALACREEWYRPGVSIADVGTGTGCIALAMASALPGLQVVAIDASPEALALAAENRGRMGLEERVQLQQGDLLEGYKPASLALVLSNPPYIPLSEIHTLARDVVDFEPQLALFSGPDGLEAIKRLVEGAFHVLQPGGLLMLEMGDDQGEHVKRWMCKQGFSSVEVMKDLTGRDRMARGMKS